MKMEGLLNAFVGGGVASAVIVGIFATVHTLVNKKVASPADKLAVATAEAAKVKAEKDEKTELLQEIKNERAGLKQDLQQLKDGLEQAETKIEKLREEALSRDYYIYRCVNAIEKLGGVIPKPSPDGMDF